MTSECIITQTHIPEYDVQGGLHAEDKLKLVDFGLKHLRQYNPSAYIILTGHGYKPRATDYCNHIIWNTTCEPINEYGYVTGMPAQYKYVYYGIEHAQQKGFSRILKTRGDCIIGRKNIIQYCDDILNYEDKQLLVTQQTGYERLGDCFMYGDTDILAKTWHKDNEVTSPDGLQNTATNYRKAIDTNEHWVNLLKRTCSFRDVTKLYFTCLRWNYFQLNKLSDEIQNAILNDTFNHHNYHWGKANGWHHFDQSGNMTGSCHWAWSEKDFYALNT